MLLAALDTFSLIASVCFLIGGVVLVIGTLRNSILQSKIKLQEEARRKEAVGEFWRTMDAAANRLEVVIAEIQEKAENRRNVLDRLSREAHQQIRRLERLIESVDAERIKELRAKRVLPNPQAKPAPAENPAADSASFNSGQAANTPAQAESPSEGSEDQSPFERSGYRQVIDAHDQGASIETICRDADMPKGEVELILTLSSRMRASKVSKDAAAPTSDSSVQSESADAASANGSSAASVDDAKSSATALADREAAPDKAAKPELES